MTRLYVWLQTSVPWAERLLEILATGHHPFDGHGHLG